MESKYVWENDEPIDLDSGEPHFDDERTLLAARPVVPLQVVTQANKRRRWLLIGAFVIASLLGSVVALALVRLQEARGADAESATTETSHQPVAQAPDAQSETELFEESFADETDIFVEPAPRTGQRRRSVVNRRSTRPPLRIVVRSNDDATDDPQPRLVDQWREQRLRRVRRQPQNHHQSDLFRIREIFEGPRRPREPLD